MTESQPAIVRKHLSFWVSQGVLREGPTDTFTIASDSTDISGRNKSMQRIINSQLSVCDGVTVHIMHASLDFDQNYIMLP